VRLPLILAVLAIGLAVRGFAQESYEVNFFACTFETTQDSISPAPGSQAHLQLKGLVKASGGLVATQNRLTENRPVEV
jgi:hypothetical protein